VVAEPSSVIADIRQGVLVYLLNLVLGVPCAFLLGLLLAITGILPYIGAWIGANPGVLLALFISPWTAVLSALGYVAIQQPEGNVLAPRIQGLRPQARPTARTGGVGRAGCCAIPVRSGTLGCRRVGLKGWALMPRILILHAAVGTGHTTAAYALADAFRTKQQGEVRVEDILDYGSKLFRVALTRAYLEVSGRAPLLWKMLYESSDLDDLDAVAAMNALRAHIERLPVRRLERFVTSYAPDAIICTHMFPLTVLQRLRRQGALRQPLYCVITDYMVHSMWLNDVVDGYFLASEPTRDAMIARGVAPTILHVTGIPVNLEISEPKTVAAVRARRGLPADLPIITLFGGGIEPVRVRRVVTQLLETPMPGLLVVAAGRSESLAESLADLGDGPSMRLRRLGMIDYVDDLVAASDLVVTKSGGLIVSEVLARGRPMIVLDPIPGQEEWNADLVTSSGAGVQLRQPESVPLAALSLLRHPERLAAMREQAARVGRPRAALDIAEHVLAELRSGAYA
jgi:processive 1,2-diacylglycerol beta-glucosyltransferase